MKNDDSFSGLKNSETQEPVKKMRRVGTSPVDIPEAQLFIELITRENMTICKDAASLTTVLYFYCLNLKNQMFKF